MHLDGRWYAVGHCHLRRALRSFRLDRIQNLRVLDETFVLPPDFDALAYLRSTMPEALTAHDVSVSGWSNDSSMGSRTVRLLNR